MLLILANYIITQNKNRDIIENGAIFIKNGKIADIGDADSIRKKYGKKAKEIIKAEGGVAMPGLINCHTHLAMVLLRGYADDLPLEKWWFEKIFPAEAKLTRDDIYWGSLLGGLEMIKSGTTTFADFYFFADEIARATVKLGLRANIGVPVMDSKAPEFETPDEALEFFPGAISRWKHNGLISFSIAPHMIQTVSLKTYKKCKKLAKKYRTLLHTHLSETKKEISHGKKNYSRTPAELLIKNKILDKQTLVAHCCKLTTKDIKLLARTGVHVVHCPFSNMKLSSGVMPFSSLKKAGLNICLGTDGACSNNSLDMFSEMKIAALLHKLAEKNPTAADAQTILDMATINGAQALSMEKEIGSIEIGKKADIIILDFNQPHLTPCHNPVSNLVYAANGNDVETVLVNGKILMKNKKVLAVDEREILKRFAAVPDSAKSGHSEKSP